MELGSFREIEEETLTPQTKESSQVGVDSVNEGLKKKQDAVIALLKAQRQKAREEKEARLDQQLEELKKQQKLTGKHEK